MQAIADKTSGAMSQAVDYLKNNPRIAAMLLAGGGAGLAGGALTAREPERATETRGSRRLRILRNALLAGGAGAGIVGLGSQGYNNLAEAVPVDSKDPFAEKLTSAPVRSLASLGAGLAGSHYGKKKDVQDFAAQILGNPNIKGNTKGMSDKELFGHAARQGKMPTVANNAVTKATAGWKPGKLTSIIRAIAGSPRALRYGIGGSIAGAVAPELIVGAKNFALGGD